MSNKTEGHLCPDCNNITELSYSEPPSIHINITGNDIYRTWSVYKCTNCGFEYQDVKDEEIPETEHKKFERVE